MYIYIRLAEKERDELLGAELFVKLGNNKDGAKMSDFTEAIRRTLTTSIKAETIVNVSFFSEIGIFFQFNYRKELIDFLGNFFCFFM